MDCLPNDLMVYFDVAMRDRVAHLVGEFQRQFWVLSRKLWVMLADVIAGFTNDLQVTDHGVLYQLILQESDFIQTPVYRAIRSMACRTCAR